MLSLNIESMVYHNIAKHSLNIIDPDVDQVDWLYMIIMFLRIYTSVYMYAY